MLGLGLLETCRLVLDSNILDSHVDLGRFGSLRMDREELTTEHSRLLGLHGMNETSHSYLYQRLIGQVCGMGWSGGRVGCVQTEMKTLTIVVMIFRRHDCMQWERGLVLHWHCSC